MGVAGQTPALTAASLVEELKAESENKREHELDERSGGAQELRGGRLIVEIDGNGAVFAGRFGGLSHVSSPCRWLSAKMRHRTDNALKDQTYGERIGASPLNPMECGTVKLTMPIIAHHSLIRQGWSTRATGEPLFLTLMSTLRYKEANVAFPAVEVGATDVAFDEEPANAPRIAYRSPRLFQHF
jgi:hypothetical protein